MNIVLVLLNIVVIIGLFITKSQTHTLYNAARQFEIELEKKESELNILNAEFAYLTSSSRIKDLASRYLALIPIEKKRIMEHLE
ncbi:MAG: hypothetical protein O3C05_01300 [Proteobacteria bacterium]|nr:hypothetical protein [Pseudomonadota bacterium]